MMRLRMPTSENKLKRKASQPIKTVVFLWDFLQVNAAVLQSFGINFVREEV